jgi:hypothetical protein
MAKISQRGEQHVSNPSGFGKEKENERKKILKQLLFTLQLLIVLCLNCAA